MTPAGYSYPDTPVSPRGMTVREATWYGAYDALRARDIRRVTASREATRLAFPGAEPMAGEGE